MRGDREGIAQLSSPYCRAHAEFQLNEEPDYPFWFTPAQFAGRLIMTKNGSHIEYFQMYVPTNYSLNVGKQLY